MTNDTMNKFLVRLLYYYINNTKILMEHLFPLITTQKADGTSEKQGASCKDISLVTKFTFHNLRPQCPTHFDS